MFERVVIVLNHIKEKLRRESRHRKNYKLCLICSAVAVLMLAVTFIALNITSVTEISSVEKVRAVKQNNIYSNDFTQWSSEQLLREQIVDSAVIHIADFAKICSDEVLIGEDELNRLWSPVNAYITLAMLAELTSENTQEEILNVLGVSDFTELRETISTVWEEIFLDSNEGSCILANSLWLDDMVNYEQEAMDILAHYYYASVYQGDLSSRHCNRAITNWLDDQTGRLLRETTTDIALEPDAMLTTISTIYFQSQWREMFNIENTSETMFYAKSCERECIFMNGRFDMNYYHSENYGAVRMPLENGSSMWFILPDKDKSTDDILNNEDYTTLITQSANSLEMNGKRMTVNLSVPQFDVFADIALNDVLKKIGLEKIFEPSGNHFKNFIGSEMWPVYLDSINQSARVMIDEKGVTAASYSITEITGSAAPAEEIIEFTLNRPFIFAICSNRVPLFIGMINMP